MFIFHKALKFQQKLKITFVRHWLDNLSKPHNIVILDALSSVFFIFNTLYTFDTEMPTARNKQQMREMILRRMAKTMQDVADKSMHELKKTTEQYYTGAEPSQYKRTNALRNTPIASDILQDANSVSCEVGLSTSHDYTSGSNPNMETVLNWAINKEAGLVGGPLKWEEAKDNIKKKLEDTFRRNFK